MTAASRPRLHIHHSINNWKYLVYLTPVQLGTGNTLQAFFFRSLTLRRKHSYQSYSDLCPFSHVVVGRDYLWNVSLEGYAVQISIRHVPILKRLVQKRYQSDTCVYTHVVYCTNWHLTCPYWHPSSCTNFITHEWIFKPAIEKNSVPHLTICTRGRMYEWSPDTGP